MKIWLGSQRGKVVKDLDDESRRSLVTWSRNSWDRGTRPGIGAELVLRRVLSTKVVEK